MTNKSIEITPLNSNNQCKVRQSLCWS